MHRKDITESDAIHLSNNHKASNTSPSCPTLRNKPNFIKTLFGYLLRYQKGLLCLFVVLLGINQAESLSAKEVVLHAETHKRIEGTGPYFVLDDGYGNTWDMKTANELLGFSMPRQDGSAGREFIDASMSGKLIKIPKGMKFKDVVAAVVADGKYYYLTAKGGGENVKAAEDDDGDVLDNRNSSFGRLVVRWSEGGGRIVSNLDLELKLDGCGYDLVIYFDSDVDIFLNTRYGNPRGTGYYSSRGSSGRRFVRYTFVSDGVGKMCNLEPGAWGSFDAFYDSPFNQTDLSKIKYRCGYNPAVWTAVGCGDARFSGFKLDSGFPTTGFKGAWFTLRGTGYDQSRYRCSSSNGGGKIALSGCTVTYLSETKGEFIAGGTPLIKMEYQEGDNVWKEMGSYQIPVPKTWAILKTGSGVALDICRGVPNGTTTAEEARAIAQKYLLRVDEVTNSPLVDPLVNSVGGGGRLYNSIDLGTLHGEWGDLFNYVGQYRLTPVLLGAFYDYEKLYSYRRGSYPDTDEVSLVSSDSLLGAYFNGIYCRGD